MPQNGLHVTRHLQTQSTEFILINTHIQISNHP